MRHRFMPVLLAAFFVAGTAFGAYQVGDSISDFTLFDSDGNHINLYDYYGKVIFINFWTPT